MDAFRVCISSLFILALAPLARAACGRPDLRFALPDEGAASVPVDARPIAIYAGTADYLGESIEVSSPLDTQTLTGTFDPVEHTLSIDAMSFEPDTEYTIAWPDLRGFGSASRGVGRTVTFRTASSPDAVAPTFEGIARIDWDVLHDRDECTDDLEDRYRFEFTVGDAVDDGGTENLVLLLFQTRGRRVADAPELVTITRFPAEGRARVDLGIEEAEGNVCFAGLVRDLAGRSSSSAELEYCVHTTAPPFFYGCTMPNGQTGPSEMLSTSVLFGLVALARRRRAR